MGVSSLVLRLPRLEREDKLVLRPPAYKAEGLFDLIKNIKKGGTIAWQLLDLKKPLKLLN